MASEKDVVEPSLEARELLAVECEANGGEMSAAALRHGERPDFFVPSACALRAIDKARLSSLPTHGEDVVELLIPHIGREVDIRTEGLVSALIPICEAYDLNDCHERDEEDALEISIGDLRCLIDALAALDSGAIARAASVRATHGEDVVERVASDFNPIAAYLAAKPGQRLLAYDIAEMIQTALEGLRPFAEVASEYDDGEDDNHEVWTDAGPQKLIRSSFELVNYRKAREAYRVLAALSVLPRIDQEVVEALREIVGTALQAWPALAHQPAFVRATSLLSRISQGEGG